MTLQFELASNGHTVTSFAASRITTDVLGPPRWDAPREVGHYQWTAWRGDKAISSGDLDHFPDMGIEYLAYLVLQDFWEDQVSRLMQSHKRTMAAAAPSTRYEAEQEIASGRHDI